MTLNLTQSQINNSSVMLKSAFQKRLSEVDTGIVTKLSMLVPSKSASETYTGLGQVPTISEFVDERKVKKLLGKSYSIANKEWEATIGVKRIDIARDSLGLYMNRVREMAARAGQHPLVLVTDLLKNGAATTCYDGQYFFDTDHLEGASGSQSNKLTGTGTTLAQVEADIAAAVAAMRNLKDDVGEPFFGDMELNGKLTFIVPPSLEYTFKKILQLTTVSTGGANIFSGLGDVFVSNRLSDSNDWYMVLTGGDMKPFIYQQEIPVEFSAQDNANVHGDAFMKSLYYYGTYASYNVGYGLWQYAVQTTNT